MCGQKFEMNAHLTKPQIVPSFCGLESGDGLLEQCNGQ